ncbi:MAG TPA: TlpA disulfide reductase family protein [Bryobacteraceae bacterium]|nr:TlpA disulfide reductase family protein [Bryobacteraceae bacterium]
MLGRKTRVLVPAGEQAPEFELKRLEGGRQSLRELLKAGPALVTFYKIGCPVCQLTAPYLERLSAGGKLQVIGVSQDDEGATGSFMQRFGVTFPTLLDQASEGYSASNAYGISSVPSLFLVEQDGRIAKSFSGFSKRDLEEIGQRAGVAPFRPDEKVPEWKAG